MSNLRFITGHFFQRLIFSLFLVLSILLASSISRAESNLDIDQLMQALASVPSGHASFVEKKSIAILEKPVESSGELFYSAPDRLEKRTLKPKAENMLLDKDKLIVEQRGKKRVLALQNYPEVAAFIDSIRGTLAGDRKSLERTYQLSLEGDAQNWNLILLPIEDKMKKIVAKISIAGSGNALQTIDILQADGDSSRMTITPLPAL
ncbi:LolA-related protein [Methylotenera versatilis]|uniref:LolA-related protein n=1 Tax=Methylotenera versatilis TaxID=1055487 RepID=UPI00068C6E76|nr:LolA-related protein [Methylotenera versatilis]